MELKEKQTKKQKAPRQDRQHDCKTHCTVTETTVRDLLEGAIGRAKDKIAAKGYDLSIAEMCKLLQMLKEYEDEDTPEEIEVRWVDAKEPSKEA